MKPREVCTPSGLFGSLLADSPWKHLQSLQVCKGGEVWTFGFRQSLFHMSLHCEIAALKRRINFLEPITNPGKWFVSLSEFDPFGPITLRRSWRATWLNYFMPIQGPDQMLTTRLAKVSSAHALKAAQCGSNVEDPGSQMHFGISYATENLWPPMLHPDFPWMDPCPKVKLKHLDRHLVAGFSIVHESRLIHVNR